MKNRTSLNYLITVMILLAGIGIVSRFMQNPMAFIKTILIFLIIGFGIYFLVRRFNSHNPAKSEQTAFKKAAKQSKKRYQQSDARKSHAKPSKNQIHSLKKVKNKKKSGSHLTVIEGNKGKKKKRASF